MNFFEVLSIDVTAILVCSHPLLFYQARTFVQQYQKTCSFHSQLPCLLKGASKLLSMIASKEGISCQRDALNLT